MSNRSEMDHILALHDAGAITDLELTRAKLRLMDAQPEGGTVKASRSVLSTVRRWVQAAVLGLVVVSALVQLEAALDIFATLGLGVLLVGGLYFALRTDPA